MFFTISYFSGHCVHVFGRHPFSSQFSSHALLTPASFPYLLNTNEQRQLFGLKLRKCLAVFRFQISFNSVMLVSGPVPKYLKVKEFK